MRAHFGKIIYALSFTGALAASSLAPAKLCSDDIGNAARETTLPYMPMGNGCAMIYRPDGVLTYGGAGCSLFP